MNADIRVSVDFWDHPKTIKLTRRLGLEGPRSLQILWMWVARHRPDGLLSDMDAEDIEIAAKWDGEEGKFVEQLVGIGWLDEVDDGYLLHDWEDHNSWAAEACERGDKARLSRLAQVNKEAFSECQRQGIAGLSRNEFKKWKGFRLANAGDRSGERPANASAPPAPAPAPAPSYNSPGNSDEQPEVSWRDEADGDVLKFVERFQQFVEQEHGKKAPKLTDSLIRKGVDTVDKLIRLDGFTLEAIRAAMHWAVKDQFWHKNVLSLAALRKKNADGVMKFQQILARYECETGESDEPNPLEGWTDWTDEQIAAMPPLGG